MADLNQHHRNLKTALSDRDNARDEIFARLLSMSPEERAKASPSLFTRLTQDQLRQLLGDSGAEKIESQVDDSATVASQKSPQKRLKSKPLKIYSPFYAALKSGLSVAVVSGAIAVAAVMFGPNLAAAFSSLPIRPIDASLWPTCPRLDAHADGCVYRVEAALTWQAAASMLHMPEATLRNINATITDLVPNTQIIVWRDRGSLTH